MHITRPIQIRCSSIPLKHFYMTFAAVAIAVTIIYYFHYTSHEFDAIEDYDRQSIINVQVGLFPHVNFPISVKFSRMLQYKNLVTNSSSVMNDVPVIVTAASSNHFRESLKLIENIDQNLIPKFPGIKLVYYDIGLRKHEVQFLKENYHINLREFPFRMFPPHVKKLKTFTWKPIIISLMLREFNFVMWTDTSIRFDRNLPTKRLFQKARKIGIQVMSGYGSIAERTVAKTMKFLRVNQRDFKDVPEIQGGWGVYSRTNFTVQKVILPWVLCALSPDCMFPGENLPISCTGLRRKVFGRCHRSDQSVLGIILTRLFPQSRSSITFVDSEYGSVQRD